MLISPSFEAYLHAELVFEGDWQTVKRANGFLVLGVVVIKLLCPGEGHLGEEIMSAIDLSQVLAMLSPCSKCMACRGICQLVGQGGSFAECCCHCNAGEFPGGQLLDQVDCGHACDVCLVAGQ